MKVQLLTTSEAARIIGLTPAGVRAASARGALRIAQRTARGVRLFDRREVERFRSARSPEPRGETAPFGASGRNGSDV